MNTITEQELDLCTRIKITKANYLLCIKSAVDTGGDFEFIAGIVKEALEKIDKLKQAR